MKILLLSLPVILSLGKFLEVDSSESSESSLTRLSSSSAANSPSRVKFSPKNSHERKQPIELPVFEKLHLSDVESTDRAESSSGSSLKGKEPAEELTVEEMRAEWRNLYLSIQNETDLESSAIETDELVKYMRKLELEFDSMRKKLAVMKPKLREVSRWEMPKDTKQRYTFLCKIIQEVSAKIERNLAILKEVVTKNVPVKTYMELLEEQEIYKNRLKDLTKLKRRCMRKLNQSKSPVSMDKSMHPFGTIHPE